jgi:hypothetical protein
MRLRLIIIAGLIALLASCIMYFVDYLIFRDTQQLLIQLVDDLAFIPISVFIVVVVLERLLARQEKLLLLNKLNMVVGAFFSEVGNSLIHRILDSYAGNEEISKSFSIDSSWTRDHFKSAIASSDSIASEPNGKVINFEDLKAFLESKRQFLLNLLENPNLMEHDKFSDLLWAIFHLAEELEARPSVTDLSGPDLKHLEGDIGRLYGQLISQWLSYAEHLKDKYPYLFSLTVRMNPFLSKPSATIM